MQIYFHSCLCSYLPRVPILVEGTAYLNARQTCLITLEYILIHHMAVRVTIF